MVKRITARDIVEAMAESDAAFQRLLKDQDTPRLHERIDECVATYNTERELINKWKGK